MECGSGFTLKVAPTLRMDFFEAESAEMVVPGQGWGEAEAETLAVF